jgi:hypothetical protein
MQEGPGATDTDADSRRGYRWGVLLLDDDDELPSQPGDDEARLSAEIGDAGLRSIDNAIGKCARPAWLKVARVVLDAIKAGGFEISDDASIRLHVRRVITLVASGALEAKGNLRRPRWSEVRLRG